MSATGTTLPLFPLETVLFPGGILPLRVFEARYMDMVRRAMRESGEFGVCLMRSGREVGADAIEIEQVGCSARIADWTMEQLGVLQIVAEGTTRFRVVDRSQQPDGLWVARVEPIPADVVVEPAADAAHCVSALERMIAHWDTPDGRGPGAPPIRSPFAQPYRFDDAAWVGNRLCETLPLPLPLKQRLMTLTDPRERLALVGRFLADKNGDL